MDEPWGQLVSVEASEERFPISGKHFVIGRARGALVLTGGVASIARVVMTSMLIVDADLVLAGNKYVSSCHCKLRLDEEGVIWLEDTR